MVSRFYGKLYNDQGKEATKPGRESINAVAMHADGDVQIAMYGGLEKGQTAKVSVVCRDHDTGSMGVSLYNGPIADLLKGGRLEVMRYLIEGASIDEKAKILTMIANKALAREFNNGD